MGQNSMLLHTIKLIHDTARNPQRVDTTRNPETRSQPLF